MDIKLGVLPHLVALDREAAHAPPDQPFPCTSDRWHRRPDGRGGRAAHRSAERTERARGHLYTSTN